MSALTIIQNMARIVGIAVPSAAVAAADRTMQEAVQMLHEAGDEIARRVDWQALRKSAVVTGSGAAMTHAMPADFSRVTEGWGVALAAGAALPLSPVEFGTLTPVAGVPRYFMATPAGLQLWPHLASGQTATAFYQSSSWTSTGARFTDDSATTLLSEDLLTKGLVVRWRRQKGMDYADFEAEFEADLADAARIDAGRRP